MRDVPNRVTFVLHSVHIVFTRAASEEGCSELTASADSRAHRHNVVVIHMRALLVRLGDAVAVFKVIEVLVGEDSLSHLQNMVLVRKCLV